METQLLWRRETCRFVSTRRPQRLAGQWNDAALAWHLLLRLLLPHPSITDRKGKHTSDGRAWRPEVMRVSDGGSSGVISVTQADGRFHGAELRSIHFLFVSPPPATHPPHPIPHLYAAASDNVTLHWSCTTGNQSRRPRTRCSAWRPGQKKGLSLYWFNCLHNKVCFITHNINHHHHINQNYDQR